MQDKTRRKCRREADSNAGKFKGRKEAEKRSRKELDSNAIRVKRYEIFNIQKYII